jgi:hypothetical protein
MKLQTWKDVLGVVVALAAAVSIVLGAMNYFARAADLKAVKEEADKKIHYVELRLDQKIVSDQMFDTKKRIWSLEERNREYSTCNQWPDERDRLEYKELLDKLEQLKVRDEELMRK